MNPKLLFIAGALCLPASAQVAGDTHWDYCLPQIDPEPFDFLVDGNYLYTGGLFNGAEGLGEIENFLRFNLTTEVWETVPGTNGKIEGSVRAIYKGNDGSIYIGGNHTDAGGTEARSVARFDPSTGTWSSLTDPDLNNLVTAGYENGPISAEVRSITQSGDFIYIGGDISRGSSPQNERRILRFNLSDNTWNPVGNGVSGAVYSMVTLANGDIIATGRMNEGLVRWDGTNWSEYAGGIGGSGICREVKLNPVDGRFYFAGNFTQVGTPAQTVNFVAAYDPTTGMWDDLNGGFDDEYRQSNGTNFNGDGVFDIAFDAAGNVYMCGDMQADVNRNNTRLNHIARWNITTDSWENLGSGLGSTGSQIVNCVAVTPEGDLFAGGTFSKGYFGSASASTQVARWDTGKKFQSVPLVLNSAVLNLKDEFYYVGYRTEVGKSYRVEFANNINFTNATRTPSINGNGFAKEVRVGQMNGAKRFYRVLIED